MKFDDLWTIHTEGFDSLQTQDNRTGNSNQYDQGLTPAEYRSTGAAEGEEDHGPVSKEKANASSIIELLKTHREKGMNTAEIDNVISKLADLERQLSASL
jgi:hypothetical protein|tara:strand:- start:15 stop:314 length:300 start_codon:yes stop_codon:yes gene_type:complete